MRRGVCSDLELSSSPRSVSGPRGDPQRRCSDPSTVVPFESPCNAGPQDVVVASDYAHNMCVSLCADLWKPSASCGCLWTTPLPAHTSCLPLACDNADGTPACSPTLRAPSPVRRALPAHPAQSPNRVTDRSASACPTDHSPGACSPTTRSCRRLGFRPRTAWCQSDGDWASRGVSPGVSRELCHPNTKECAGGRQWSDRAAEGECGITAERQCGGAAERLAGPTWCGAVRCAARRGSRGARRCRTAGRRRRRDPGRCTPSR